MKYVVLQKMPIGVRLALYGAAAAAGVALQMVFDGLAFLGIILVASAAAVMFAKSYRNKPEDLGYEDWKPVSFAEYQKVRTNLEQSKKNRLSLYYKPGAKVLLIVPGLVLLFFSFFFGIAGGLEYLPRAVINIIILALPLTFSGLIKLWIPRELAMKVSAFYPIAVESQDGDLVITPYLRFDRDKEGREIPEDIRFMVELRRNPEDFVGIQLQVAINNGPNGAVPYMYAVYLCRGKGATYRRFSAMDFGGYVTEAGGDSEYGTVVVRQRTSGGGYYTTPDQCNRLFETVCEGLAGLG